MSLDLPIAEDMEMKGSTGPPMVLKETATDFEENESRLENPDMETDIPNPADPASGENGIVEDGILVGANKSGTMDLSGGVDDDRKDPQSIPSESDPKFRSAGMLAKNGEGMTESQSLCISSDSQCRPEVGTRAEKTGDLAECGKEVDEDVESWSFLLGDIQVSEHSVHKEGLSKSCQPYSNETCIEIFRRPPVGLYTKLR